MKRNSKFVEAGRILIIAPTPPAWGGARVSSWLFLEYLKIIGIDEYEHISLPFNCEAHNFKRFFFRAKSFFYFMKILVTIRRYSKIVFFASRNTGMFYGSLLTVAGWIWNKPIYIRFFGGHPINSKFLSVPLLNACILRCLKCSRRIVVQTNSGASEFPDFLQKNISVVPGYRPKTQFKRVPAASVNNAKKIIRFLFVGNLSREKGVESTLDAFVCLRDRGQKSTFVTIDLFGYGDQKILRKYEMSDSISYRGSVENDRLREQLPQYDILVFSSAYENEGHPGVLIEAMMAGLTIIASSSTASVLEVITHQVNGLIVPPGNVHALRSAMELLIVDDILREVLADKALQDSKQYRSEVVLPRMARIFELID